MESLNFISSNRDHNVDRTNQRMLHERQMLLESIKRLHDSDVDDLKADFNRVVRSLDSIHTKRFRDPLDALPYEVWVAIILEGATFIEETISIISVDELLNYTLVSSEWAEAIVSTPTLWCDLHIADKVHDLAVKVHMVFHLSKVYMINLIVENEFRRAWEDVSRIIIPESHRFRSITILQPTQDLRGELNALGFLLNLQRITSFTVFPSIFQLSPRPTRSPLSSNLEIFLRKTPALQYLHGAFISGKTLNDLNLPSLKSVFVDVGLGPFKPLRGLRDISVMLQSIKSVLGPVEDYMFVDITDDSLLWDSLTMQMPRYTLSVESLLRRTAGTLLSLEISIDGRLASTLFSACSSMPQLHTLTLCVWYPERSSTEPFVLVVSPSSLKYLDISLLWMHEKRYKWDTVDVRNHPRDQRQDAKAVFDLLTTWAPHVEHLRVKAPDSLPEILSYVGGLSRLSSCDLEFESISYSLLTTRTIGLQSHRVNFSGTAATFELLFGDDVWFMELYASNLVECPTLNSNYWPNLRTLDLRTIPKEWDNIFFPHLQKIRLRSQGWMTFQMGYTSPFLEKIARDPETLPALQILELGSIPEWDLLMIMLECRNCSMNPNLARIKSISVPTLPSPFIIKPLSQLLRGELPIEDSLFNYSMAEIAPAYFDSTVTGCSQCHLLRLPCGHSVTKLSDWVIEDASLSFEHLTEYPATREGVIWTWRSRYKRWTQGVEHVCHTRRWGLCDKHVLDRLCEITGYTLHDSNISCDISPVRMDS